MALKNDLLLRAANGDITERPPVWVMRQAGRILKEYRDIRSSLSGFKELVETPALAAEVTIQPVDILGVDAAIIFSDILVIPEAMGLPYRLIEKKGPWFDKTIESQSDVERLIHPDPEVHLNYVLEAIRITKHELNERVPLIGFAGAPWTIFSYMIEGQGTKTFAKARKMLYSNPTLSHQLLQKITDATIVYLQAQAKAGADLLQIFDSWAGILPRHQYLTFGLPYIKQICEALPNIPVTVFAKGAWYAMDEIGKLPCQTVGLDWNMSVEDSMKMVANDKTLQGNLDPCQLYDSFENIQRSTTEMLKSFGTRAHIANLGHGVYPDTNPDKVKCFIDTVKEFKR